MPEQTEAPAATEGQDGDQQEASVSTEEAMDAAFDSTQTEGEVQEQTTSEFDWSQYQNVPDSFKGRNLQDVINHYGQFTQQYGNMTNELGGLRNRVSEQERQLAEYKRLREQIAGQKEKEPVKFTEGQQYEFISDWNKNPLSALQKHLGPQLADVLAEQLIPKVSEQIIPKMQEQVQSVAIAQERNAFFAKYGEEYNKDARLQETMAMIMSPQYLGDNVPYEEAFQLAQMYRDEPNLSFHTTMLMRQGVPFKNAKEYAMAMANSAQNAETKKDTIRSDVEKVKYGTKKSATKQGTEEPEIITMDDAFDRSRS